MDEERRALMDERDTARYLGVSTSALRVWRLDPPRVRTVGPPFIRMGRTIRYRVADVDDWIEGCRVIPK